MPILMRGIRVPGQDRDPKQEFLNDFLELRCARFAGHPIAQLAFGYRRNRDLCHWNAQEMTEDSGNVSLDDVACDIRVQQIPARHQNSSPFFLGSSPLSSL